MFIEGKKYKYRKAVYTYLQPCNSCWDDDTDEQEDANQCGFHVFINSKGLEKHVGEDNLIYVKAVTPKPIILVRSK